jgi:hypothetical protein
VSVEILGGLCRLPLTSLPRSSTRLRGLTVGLARNAYNIVSFTLALVLIKHELNSGPVARYPDRYPLELPTQPHSLELGRIHGLLLGRQRFSRVPVGVLQAPRMQGEVFPRAW